MYEPRPGEEGRIDLDDFHMTKEQYAERVRAFRKVLDAETAEKWWDAHSARRGTTVVANPEFGKDWPDMMPETPEEQRAAADARFAAFKRQQTIMKVRYIGNRMATTASFGSTAVVGALAAHDPTWLRLSVLFASAGWTYLL
jgi:hypothetical protein